MTPDGELLRRYAGQGDEAAFAEVVRRHVDLVYSAALRLVGGDTHLAQDVAQGVFTALARRAARLAGHASIAGWLYTTTRFTAGNLRRDQHRRIAREQEAYAMDQPVPTPDINWDALQPVLDEAVCALAATDREAVLLRFFQNKSHREVGDVLGLGEDAARKRVDRALDKLRAHFAKRGVALSSGALAAVMSANTVQAAPVGLAESLTRTSLAGAGSVKDIFLKKFLMNSLTKLLVVSTTVIGLAWLCWQFTTPDLQMSSDVPARQPAKPAHAPLSLKLPSGARDSIPDAQIVTNDATPQTTSKAQYNRPSISLEATPIRAPVPDEAHLTTPLANAEHHIFILKTMTGYTFDASLVGYRHVLDSNGKDRESVQLYVWQNSGAAHIADLDLDLGYFSPEDQDYIRNWARQQAASPTANQPSTAPMPLIELRQLAEQMGIPLSSPDWPSQVQARLQSNNGVTNSESSSQTDVQPAPPPGPTVITN